MSTDYAKPEGTLPKRPRGQEAAMLKSGMPKHPDIYHTRPSPENNVQNVGAATYEAQYYDHFCPAGTVSVSTEPGQILHTYLIEAQLTIAQFLQPFLPRG